MKITTLFQKSVVILKETVQFYCKKVSNELV